MSRVTDLVAGAGDGRRGRGGGVAVGGEHVAGGGAVDNLCNRIVSKGAEAKYLVTAVSNYFKQFNSALNNMMNYK